MHPKPSTVHPKSETYPKSQVLRTGGAMLDISGLLSESTYQCEACLPGTYEISLTVSKGEIEDPARRQATALITVKIVPGSAQVFLITLNQS